MPSNRVKKQQPIKKMFLSGIQNAIGTPQEKLTYDDTVWKCRPYRIGYFCKNFLDEPLFPEQLKFCRAMTGDDRYNFSDEFDEGHAFWGKGAGKDRTIAKLVIYQVYKLLCLRNPHKFFREKYNCSIGDGDAFDIANMSVNARQANIVFFKKFKQLVRVCKNPNTGKNWFEEQGVDLREGYDILKDGIRFGNGISAHSLNSETHTGEGLNLFFVTIDELGAFKPPDKALGLVEAVRGSITSRFKKYGKLCIISYHYYRNDPMHLLYEMDKNNPRIYSSKKATYEVNTMISKKDLAKFYAKNPDKAKMTYECDSKDTEGGYVTKRYMLEKMFSPEYENPIKGNLISVDATALNSLVFKEWFKGGTYLYAIHVDLASGKKEDKSGNIKKRANDLAGLTMTHVEKMFPKIDMKLRKELAAEGFIVEMTGDDVARKGLVNDLSIQIMARRGQEIQMSDIRNFIIRLKVHYGFNIIMVSYDGWESRDSIQILNQSGIEAELLSVDKTNEAYDTWKELMYQQLVKAYPNPIAEREAKELIVDDKGKVDHPELSWDRFKIEGIEVGSKDVMDSIVGSCLSAYKKIGLESDIFFG